MKLLQQVQSLVSGVTPSSGRVSSSSFEVLTTSAVGGETPATIAQTLSDEKIMIWMAEQHIIKGLPGGSP